MELEQAPRTPEPAADAHDQAVQKEQAPIGTRLTMTSRTGYFQDRIISPSMGIRGFAWSASECSELMRHHFVCPVPQMRAMAILYIGPHRNPDFQSDYQLSPILAPDHLLAHFPPLLMSCGEKDPFVDDTLIFAGRVRKAKRARRADLERILAGKSALHGEHLRMSAALPHLPPGVGRNDNIGREETLRALQRECHR
ncbi:hypothetical protein NUW54_g10199 [Trametes sanguinea]|uniref:Uncharacterized protein n=1 Tax=Trametes sanguinea TaxID=158606 RepID=A0ACC1P292_9APHY|nr:hypothetical protein NUW54_g10199 [Trametes sanguinea]